MPNDDDQNECSAEQNSSPAEQNSCSAPPDTSSAPNYTPADGGQTSLQSDNTPIGPPPPPPADDGQSQSTPEQNYTPADGDGGGTVLAGAAPLLSQPDPASNFSSSGDSPFSGEAANDNALADQAANDNAVVDEAADQALADDAVADTATDLAGDAVTDTATDLAGDAVIEEGSAGILEIIGAPFAAVGAGLAVFFWSSPTEPAWVDSRNPITGDFYKSEEEAKEVARMTPEEIQAKIAERKKKELDAASQDSSGQSCGSSNSIVQACTADGSSEQDQQPSQSADPATDPDADKKKTCATEYPELNLCDGLPAKYRYGSEGEAFDALKKMTGSTTLKKTTRAVNTADSSPCQGQGEHINVRDGKSYAGSIVWCPCCIETASGPVLSKRYAVI